MTESEHPPAFLLDAVAAGDTDVATEEHVASCAACRRYVDALRAELGADDGRSTANAATFAANVLARAETETKTEGKHAPVVALAPRRSRVRTLVWSVAPLVALAAGVLLFVRATPTKPGENPLEPSTTETRFKGGYQLAVVRDRAGKQERFTAELPARAGDRLRLEVAVDERRPLVAGVLGKDGSWTVLLSPSELASGTHFSEEGARFDDDQVEGWILAGPPGAVEDARHTHVFEGVRVIPIVLERP